MLLREYTEYDIALLQSHVKSMTLCLMLASPTMMQRTFHQNSLILLWLQNEAILFRLKYGLHAHFYIPIMHIMVKC